MTPGKVCFGWQEEGVLAQTWLLLVGQSNQLMPPAVLEELLRRPSLAQVLTPRAIACDWTAWPGRPWQLA